MSLINCEVYLTLTSSKTCVLTSKATKYTTINNPTNATFKITDTKLYVRVATLSAQDDISF